MNRYSDIEAARKLTIQDLIVLNPAYKDNIAGRNIQLNWQQTTVNKDYNDNKAKEIINILHAKFGINIKDTVIVEIGCGRAGLINAIANYCSKAIGFDIQSYDNMTTGKADIRITNGINTELEDNSCDIVISIASIEHYNNPELVFAEVMRILKAGGLFYINTGGFFRSNIGGHLYDKGINVPFPQLLFSKQDIEKFKGTSVFNGLNFISLEEFNQLIIETGFENLLYTEISVKEQEKNNFEKFKNILSQYREEDLFIEYVKCILQKPRTYKKKEKYIPDKNNIIKEHIQQGFTDILELSVMYDCILKSPLSDIVYSLEIGSYTGMTTSFIARLIKNFNSRLIAIDPFMFADKQLMNPKGDLPGFLTNLNKFRVSNLVTTIISKSNIAHEFVKNIKFGFMFVDGSHEYEDVISDIKLYSELLIKNGFMFFDDYSEKHNSYPGVTKAIQQLMFNNPNFELYYKTDTFIVFKRIN